ncbi:MAG: hypothetical protein ACQEVT_16735 [Pseudomonadota bacterium]
MNLQQKKDLIRAHAEAHPDTEMVPITTKQAAKVLGLPSDRALQNLRSRNKKEGLPVPPGLTFVPGLGYRYGSALELRLWAVAYHHSRLVDVEGGGS